MKSTVDRRIVLLMTIFATLLLVAGARAAYLGTAKRGQSVRSADSQQVREVVVPGNRGTIVDRHGLELAVSEPAFDVSATPYLVKEPLAVAKKIAPILKLKTETVLTKLSQKNSGFVYLAREVPIKRGQRLKRLGIEGIDITATYQRTYPRSYLASQLVGAVGIDGNGLSGLEYGLDKTLHGTDGKRRIVKDGLGRSISLTDQVKTDPGKDVQLTIDAAIQDKVEAVLADVGAKFHPKGATAVVMDPRNGSILALANWPRVDANDFGAAPGYARQERATGTSYEPGSTFKAFTVAGALEDGLVTPSTVFSLPPTIIVADREIGESHPRGSVSLTTAQILAQSSNVGAIKIGIQLGKERFDHWVRKFGFGSTTGIDFPAEATGIVPDVKDYSGSSIGNLPIGQGLAVTPIQIATAYAAIANGGILRPAHVIESVDGVKKPIKPGKRIISASTAASLRSMLKGVFAAGGTASEVHIPGYQLAGKTGTANKVDPTTGTYSESKYVASFVGFVPANKPKLLVTVMVDEPQGEIYGGLVAAPAFQKILSFTLPYLGIPPSQQG